MMRSFEALKQMWTTGSFAEILLANPSIWKNVEVSQEVAVEEGVPFVDPLGSQHAEGDGSSETSVRCCVRATAMVTVE